MNTGLAALLHPHSVSDFLAHSQRDRPLVVHRLKGHDRRLTTLPFLDSLDALLASWPSAVGVHLPDVRDESHSMDVGAGEALRFFNEGMGLLFSEAQVTSPVLTDWLQGIRRDLGLSTLTNGRCLIYATPAGKGTAPHFDQNLNFVLQIHGTKTWTLAPNTHVQNPLSRHVIGLPTDPELSTYVDRPMPESMPDDAASYELAPGSLLFVPRGCWHSTEAHDDALSLNFTFTAPSWLDLFTAALRSRLALSAEWRRTAVGVSDPEERENATQEFDQLLAGLVGDLPNWVATDILDVTETDPTE
jgi:50S ribosomal protein L16 3-hydroxylase